MATTQRPTLGSLRLAVNKYSLRMRPRCDAAGLFGSAIACYVSKLVAVIAADFVLATTAAAATAATSRAVTRPVIS